MLYRLMLVPVLVAASVHFTTTSLEAQDAAASDPMGYFLGLSVGQQMKSQGFQKGDFDVNALAAGLADALANQKPRLENEQLKEAGGKIQALLAKRQQKLKAEMEKAGVANKEQGDAWLKSNAEKEGIQKTASGLQYKVIEEGDGPSPSASDSVKVHYTGKLIDGTVFDSSVQRGEPASFQVGQVIKGWQEGLQMMKVGGKRLLFIPSDLAYGPQGRPGAIGPNSVLVFEVELLEIQ